MGGLSIMCRTDSAMTMGETIKLPPTGGRPPRLLWATPCCLLDTSSGAALSAREMLRQLAAAGVDVKVLGASVFDRRAGASLLEEQLPAWQQQPGKRVFVRDGSLTHELITTASVQRDRLTAAEADAWRATYEGLLEAFCPDVVWSYGGRTLELFASAEARGRGIAHVAYLANPNFTGTRWLRDTQLAVTPSRATAEHMGNTLPCPVRAVGRFIAPGGVVADAHRRERLLFVNPLWCKGAGIVAQLAIMMGRLRPDIVFEVVEARGTWSPIVRAVTRALGEPRETLPNVVTTPHTADMRPVYARARLLLAPSLWWEAGPRVVVEAMLNGIPAVITDRGGAPEAMGDGGIRVQLPSACHELPYTELPGNAAHEDLIRRLIHLFDDEAAYQALARKADRVGRDRHSLTANTRQLLDALAPLFDTCPGDHARPPDPPAPHGG